MRWENFVGTFVGRERVGTHLLRLRFEIGGGTAAGYLPIEPGDESIAFYHSSDGTPLHARTSDDPEAMGGWEIADEERSIGHRNFTVRSFDPDTREMVVDIAEHGHGPAIEWFRAAEPGWRLLMAGPRSWYAPTTTVRHVLAGDLAALPALARIVEGTDPATRITAIVEILDRRDLSYLPEHPNLEIVEVIGSGNGVTPTRLSEALTQVELDDDTYCWFAGEAADIRAAKKHLRSLGWTRDRYTIVGYWRQNADQWTKDFEAKRPELVQVYQDALAAGNSAQEAADLYEAALEKAGL